MMALMTASMRGYFQPISPPLTRDECYIYGSLRSIEENDRILEKFDSSKESEMYTKRVIGRLLHNIDQDIDQHIIFVFSIPDTTEDPKWEDKYSPLVIFTEFEVPDGKIKEVFGEDGEGRKIARRIAEKEWEEIEKMSMEPVNPREIYTYFELSFLKPFYYFY